MKADELIFNIYPGVFVYLRGLTLSRALLVYLLPFSSCRVCLPSTA